MINTLSQTCYIINTTKKSNPHHYKRKIDGLFKKELDLYGEWESENGIALGTIDTHRQWISKCLDVLTAAKRKVILGQIGTADIGRLRKSLEKCSLNNAEGYVRLFAQFLSVVTQKPPLIDPGRYGRHLPNGHLMVQSPGLGFRSTWGTPEERKKIESDYSDFLECLARTDEELGFSASTSLKHTRCVCAALFILSRKGRVDTTVFTEEDRCELMLFLDSNGVQEASRIVNRYEIAVKMFAGDPLPSRIGPRSEWAKSFRDQFPYENELAKVRAHISPSSTKSHQNLLVSRVRVCGGILVKLFGKVPLDEITAEHIERIESELGKYLKTKNTVRLFIMSFQKFIGLVLKKVVRFDCSRSFMERFQPELESEEDREFLQHLSRYGSHLETIGYHDSTIVSKVYSVVRNYRTLKELKGRVELFSLTGEDLVLLRNSLRLKDSTVRNYLYSFAGFVKFVTGRDLLDSIRLMFNGDTCNREFIFDNEWKLLYKAADPMQKLILSLGATMGLRRGEILGLRLDDISGTKLRIKGKGHGPDGKQTVLEMSDLVCRDITDYLVIRKSVIEKWGDRSEGMLFIHSQGTRRQGAPLSVTQFKQSLSDLSARAGVHLATHALRRFFCMTLVDADIDLDTVRRMMRHESLETTLQCYVYADPRKLQLASTEINRRFSAFAE